jgi:Tfp pilus assembly PilM family ATPase
MSSLGIYFGPKVISIAETKGKKFINKIEIPQSAIFATELEEKVPAETKLIEIVALFKDELRKNKIEAKDAVLCLCGRDLIIRTFEIPMLPKEELKGAINFEAKKYIPFKMEELISDFQVELDKQSRTNLILFVGIKKDIFERYISILDQLDIKITALEYSGFTVLRCLNLAGLSERGVVGVLGVDLRGEDEVNFTVLENGFPLFSRDMSLTTEHQEFMSPEEKEPTKLLEKLRTEVTVSIDYYERKFPTKIIKKIFLISNPDYRSDLETFITELGLSSQFVDLSKYLDKSLVYSLSLIKAYSASLFKAIKTNLKINLLAVRERVRPLKEKTVQIEAVSLLEGLRLDPRIVLTGLLISLLPLGYGLHHKRAVLNKLNNIKALRPQLTTVSPDVPIETLTDLDSEYKRKLSNLNNLIKNQLYLTYLLDIVPRVLPKGTWLKNFSFNKLKDEKAELILEGMVYLADSDKEFETANRFFSNLNAEPNFKRYFKDISLVSLDRRQLERITVTYFSISCKTYYE